MPEITTKHSFRFGDAMNLLSTDPPYVLGALDDSFLAPESDQNYIVIRFIGSELRTLEALFRAYVREFQFPEYFGWNWAAFDGCITTLENLPAHGYLTIIDRAEDVLADEPNELEAFEDALINAGESWARSFALPEEFGSGPVPFHTIMIRTLGSAGRLEEL